MNKPKQNGKQARTAPPVEQLLERRPPAVLDAEAALLGSLILKLESLDDIPQLEADDFYDDGHRRVFTNMVAMYDGGIQNFDVALFKERLVMNDEWEVIGGAPAIAKISQAAPNAAHVVYYANLVREAAIRRRVIEVGTNMVRDGYDEGLSAERVLDDAQGKILDVSESSSREASAIKDIVDRGMAQIEARMNGERTEGVDTLFNDLDHMTGGLAAGELIILAGRPSMGKTAFVLNVLENVAVQQKEPVLFFSLEMSELELADRLLCSRGRANAHRARNGTLSQDDRHRLIVAAGEIASAPMHVDDSARCTVREMVAMARRVKRKHGLSMIAIDYLQLIEPADDRKPKQEQLEEISRSLKIAARQLNVPILCLAQLNRQSEGNKDFRPTLSNLRGCFGERTRVTVMGGSVVRIDELRAGDYVESFDLATQSTCLAPVRDVIDTGIQTTFQVETNLGRRIRLTDNHPVLTESGWRPVADIKPGDVIAAPFRTPKVYPSKDGDLQRLIGYLVGNGTYRRHGSVGVVIPDEAAFADCVGIIKAHFPEIQVRECGPYNDVAFTIGRMGGPGCNPLINWIKSIGVHGQVCHQKRLPAMAFNGDGRDVIAGYFAADGCVTKSRGRWAIRFDSTSRALLEDVMILLNRNGIAGSISKGMRNTLSKRDIFRLSLSEAVENLRQFATTVDVRGVRGERLRTMLAELPPHNRRGHTQFRLPSLFSAKLASVGGWRHQGKSVSRAKVFEYANGDPDLLVAARSDVIWDQVSSIGEPREERTYDVLVAGTNCVIADGIVAHNSGAIEQDADVVMFVHREEYYRRGEEAQAVAGQADIIIAKQRNGPVGDVELVWRKEFMRFEDKAPERLQGFDSYDAQGDLW